MSAKPRQSPATDTEYCVHPCEDCGQRIPVPLTRLNEHGELRDLSVTTWELHREHRKRCDACAEAKRLKAMYAYTGAAKKRKIAKKPKEKRAAAQYAEAHAQGVQE